MGHGYGKLWRVMWPMLRQTAWFGVYYWEKSRICNFSTKKD